MVSLNINKLHVAIGIFLILPVFMVQAKEPIDLFADPGTGEENELDLEIPKGTLAEDAIYKEELFFGKPLAVWLGIIESDDYLARLAAATTLSRIGPSGKAAIPILCGILRQEHDYIFKRKIVEALGSMGEVAKQAIPDLQQTLYQEGLREVSAVALGQIRNDTPVLKPLGERALTALRKGDAEALNALAFEPFKEVIQPEWLAQFKERVPAVEPRFAIRGTREFSFVRILFGEDDPFPDNSIYLEFRLVQDENDPEKQEQKLSAVYMRGR